MTLMTNPLLQTDSYKFSHFSMLPPGTTEQSSYIESRGGFSKDTLFFGLQMFLKSYMRQSITKADVEAAEAFALVHGEPFNREGFMKIVNRHGGFWPVEIQAVLEGTVVPTKNVLVQVRNTDPELPWVTSFLETALLRAVWYPTTVATNSLLAKRAIWKYLNETADDPTALIDFKLHDFGARGVSSHESAMIGGAAHLVNFMGSDTIEGILAANMFYGAGMAGFSIPASEHSVMTSWGGPEGEVESMRNILNQFAKPGAMFACVSDSYDIRRAAREYWGGALKQQILDSGVCVVVRPDSGDPLTVPVEIVQILWEQFGGTMNSKGYKVLNPAVRVIQGDGITHESIPLILENLKSVGFSTENIAMGMGGGLLQQINRDTLNFAMKCSEVVVNGENRDVFKAPSDQLMKVSKKGRLALMKTARGLETVREDQLGCVNNELKTVWKNGELLVDQTFQEIRTRANREFV